MSSLQLRNVFKHYDQTPVIHGVDIDIPDGEFVALVGPSGCGKSTLLRAIAGLEGISGGEIRLGGRVINDVAPRDRGIAMVFQNYALYPHMSVRENLGFAMKLQGVPRAEINTRVLEVAQVLGLTPLLDRRPRQLSGGQRQRVAMGRAIVRRPEAFLFDEPLSNLDAKLRVQMRTEIRALHQRLRTTTIYVTHDQVEAMTMADRIVVLRDGRVEQVGTPLELYDRPRNAFVAGFIGSPSMNFIPGRVTVGASGTHVLTDDGLSLPLVQGAAPEGARVLYGARPEHFEFVSSTSHSAEVIVVEPTGAETQVALRLGRHEVLAAFRERLQARPGERLALRPQAAHAHLFDADSGLRLN
ncbi:sn-glycerol-3-phosphate ABC transporter ATP-binding protein UgpC [Variovorax dokdonensis]|uniref:Sn-glycerol-3-phosphate ABC transporter ATP-binding protein UgpC n=1 Tax=Variovorax dokdonensis TaxID=344883 RepID=A0ABT7ND29_9BURK|nr:sn-glycerol-3-phosphate ABC transporter ATP-binding protein UgpC [Variovorax dokdonensis]MDM0045857.1 sn-glycerol-3-phosphate ABC transporter ATP-binding protein UgpC [Variovorax dokdonensis]